MCIDVTASTRQRHELETALQAEAVLNETVQILYSEPELEKALDLMLAHMGLYLRAERCAILNVEGNSLHCSHEWCQQGIESQKASGRSFPCEAWNVGKMPWHATIMSWFPTAPSWRRPIRQNTRS